MLPDFEAWAMFAAVADQGSFRAAAALTGVSVPTVSKAVARLEGRIGLALFHRTSRRVTLTGAGTDLLPRARAIAAAGAAAEEAAREDPHDLTGPIRLTAPISIGMACVGEALARFLEHHPGVILDVVLSDAQCDLVADGMDMGLRIAQPAPSSLLIRHIVPVPLALVASPDYLARHGEPRTAMELNHHRMLGYGHLNRAAGVTLTSPDGIKHSVTPTGPVFANNGEMMVPMLLAGLGMALLPRFMVRDHLCEGALVETMKDWSNADLSLSLVSPPSRLRPARVRALGDHLVEWLQHHPMFAAV